jgi:NRPS condensation-like uncharacterized protein
MTAMAEVKINNRKTGRFTAEAFDQLQFIFGEADCNDHHIRCIFKFAGRLDREIIHKAVMLSIEAFPILGSRFREESSHLYWQKIDSNENERAFKFLETEDFDQGLEALFVSKTDTMRGPQVNITLLRGPHSDGLVVVINHMISDAGGFKKYLNMLASIYSSLESNPDFTPQKFECRRDLGQVFERFSFIKRMRLYFLMPTVSNKAINYLSCRHLPVVKAGKIAVFTRLIHPSRFSAIKEYCRAGGFTVNDVILAAYYMAVYRTLPISDEMKINIPCSIDLRRLMRDREKAGICNLSGWLYPEARISCHDTLDSAALKIHAGIEKKKKQYPGMGGLLLLDFVFKYRHYSGLKAVFKKNPPMPLFCMTNLGILDEQSLKFGSMPLIDAFIIPSIKYPPYFQLALSTFKDACTLSLNLPDTLPNQNLANDFLREMDEILPSAIPSPAASSSSLFK